ncbi:MAG: twin-arginine translocation signal domain-containing protein [Thermodesulfobacteria bacterium]|nr:twin-arginine translocation signal domain-containing protein [Thermodesulfobacteriota bacterium]
MDRRDFLKSLLLASCAGVIGMPQSGFTSEEAPRPKHAKVPPLPWGYKELDPDEALRRGHLGYMVGE